MSKVLKNMVISEIANRLGDNRDLIVVDSSKLDPNTTHKLRASLRAKKIKFLAVRNTLAQQVLASKGVNNTDAIFKGPSTLVWGGDDVVALSKEITKWVKDIEKLELKGGTVEGSTLMPADVERLSKSPGRLELIGQIAGLILSPGAQLAGALLGPGGYLAGQVKAKAEGEETSETTEAATEAPAPAATEG
jgi:large subunit ribosomal protein L10